MVKKEMKGVLAALLTPLDEEDRVDERRLERLVNFLADRGIDGLYLCGGTGECLLLSVEERKRVAALVKEQVGDRLLLIAHVGGAANTADAVELARHAERLQLDGVASFPPVYYRYRFANIRDYYRTVAESTGLPFLVYYIPATSGVVLSDREFAQIAEIRNVVGLKYTAPDMYQLQKVLLQQAGRWIAFSGPDELFLPALTMGASGCIGSTQNVLPELFLEIYRSFTAGDIHSAVRLQERVTRAVTMFFDYGPVVSWKTALQFRGVDAGFCRPPLARAISGDMRRQFAREWEATFPDFSEGL